MRLENASGGSGRRGWGRRLLRWGAYSALALVLLGALIWNLVLPAGTRFGLKLLLTADGSWADLRNERAMHPDEASIEHGRRLLREAARRHGLEQWRGHRTVSITAVDSWPGDNKPWWPAGEQRFRHDLLLGTFTSRAVLLNGPAQGEVRGLQSWHAYRAESSGAAPVFLTEPDPAIEFYLPTLQYFAELPVRLLTVELVTYAGQVRHRGRDYDLVFGTWGDWEPHGEHDQYVIWIGRDSGLIEKLHYTVRDAVAMAPPEQRKLMRKGSVGTIHYEQYRDVDGVNFPFEQYVTLFGPDEANDPPSEGYFHALRIESVVFDAVPAEELMPRADLPAPSAGKPQS